MSLLGLNLSSLENNKNKAQKKKTKTKEKEEARERNMGKVLQINVKDKPNNWQIF